MSYHWAWHRDNVARHKPSPPSQPPASPTPSKAPSTFSNTDWSDPPALDDNLAKQLVATISFFLKEHQRFEDAGAALGPIGSVANTQYYPEASRKQSFHSIPHSTHSTFSRDGDERPIVPSLMSEILAQVAKICFFVSASNWTIVLGKIKNRIAYWSGPEEFPDRSETRLLEFCSLNRARLSSIIRELSSQFVHLKRSAQSDIALALRRSIWNWIETYPIEYVALVRSNGRLEGAPDVLFDVAHGLSDNGKKRSYTWPMMSMLLAVCPDVVLKITVGDRTRSQVVARKAAFIESLRKNLKTTKLADVATACCVDLCKAATFSPKTTAEGPGLRLLALDLMPDLNSRLLDASKPFTNAEGQVEISIMSDALAALFKLDRHYVDSNLLDKCLSRNSFPPFQIAFIQACHKLAVDPVAEELNMADTGIDEEDRMSDWNVKLKELYPAIASLLRSVFMSAVLESEQFNLLIRTTSKSGFEDTAHRTDLCRAVLNLWSQDYRLAFYQHSRPARSKHVGSRSAHDLHSSLAAGSPPDPDDLEMFIYLTTSLLDGRNPRSVRQAAMKVLRAYHQPIIPSPRHLDVDAQGRTESDIDLRYILRYSRPVVGTAILKRLLETWTHREEEREVLQVFKVFLDRFREAVEESEKGNSVRTRFPCRIRECLPTIDIQDVFSLALLTVSCL